MRVFDIRRSQFNPPCGTSFIDSCAFDPKYSPEHESAEQIRLLWKSGQVLIVIAHSTAKEIAHPNTPSAVKAEAATMFKTYETLLTPREESRKRAMHVILTGNGNPDKVAADATHVFDARKYGGCFVTTDYRILSKAKELSGVWPTLVIVKPSDWLSAYRAGASQVTPIKR